MKKILKRILAILLAFIVMVSAVTYKPVKVSATVGIALTIEEIVAYVLGGTTYSSMLLNNDTKNYEIFDRRFQIQRDFMVENLKDTVLTEQQQTYYNTICAMTDAAASTMAWNLYSTEQEWENGIGDSGISWPELAAELYDFDVENYDLWSQMVQKNHPTEPPDNESGNVIKKILAALGLTMLGAGMIAANEAGMFDAVTGEFINVSESLNANNFKINETIKSTIKSYNPRNYKIYENIVGSAENCCIWKYQQEGRTDWDFKIYSKGSPLGQTSIYRIEGTTSTSSTNQGLSMVLNINADCPIFGTQAQAQSFVTNGDGIENAENYTALTADQLKIKNAINMYNDALHDATEAGYTLPFENIAQAQLQEVADLADEIQDDDTITTPEDVKDKVKKQINDDLEKVMPVVPGIDLPVTPTDPVDPVDPPDPTDPEDGELGGVLATVFPFCIPFDLIFLIKSLQAEPTPPRWEIPFEIDSIGYHDVVVIDFVKFEPVAEVCRSVFTILFILILILLTRKLIKG